MSKFKPSIKTDTAAARVLAFVAANPETSAPVIARALDLSKGTVAPTIKTLVDTGKLVVPTVLVDADTLTPAQAAKYDVLPGDKVRIPKTHLVVDDNGKPVAGRPSVALKVTDKGRKAAQRIVERAAQIAAQAEEVAEAEVAAEAASLATI